MGGVFYDTEKYIDRFLSRYKWTLWLLCAVYITVTYVIRGSFQCSVLTGINLYGIILSLFSIVLLISICKKFKENRMIQYIGKHTIAFYFMSASIPFACCKVVERFLHFESAIASALVFLAEFVLSFSADM